MAAKERSVKAAQEAYEHGKISYRQYEQVYQDYIKFYEQQYLPAVERYKQYREFVLSEREKSIKETITLLSPVLSEEELRGVETNIRYFYTGLDTGELTKEEFSEKWQSYLKTIEPIIVKRTAEKYGEFVTLTTTTPSEDLKQAFLSGYAKYEREVLGRIEPASAEWYKKTGDPVLAGFFSFVEPVSKVVAEAVSGRKLEIAEVPTYKLSSSGEALWFTGQALAFAAVAYASGAAISEAAKGAAFLTRIASSSVAAKISTAAARISPVVAEKAAEAFTAVKFAAPSIASKAGLALSAGAAGYTYTKAVESGQPETVAAIQATGVFAAGAAFTFQFAHSLASPFYPLSPGAPSTVTELTEKGWVTYQEHSFGPLQKISRWAAVSYGEKVPMAPVEAIPHSPYIARPPAGAGFGGAYGPVFSPVGGSYKYTGRQLVGYQPWPSIGYKLKEGETLAMLYQLDDIGILAQKSPVGLRYLWGEKYTPTGYAVIAKQNIPERYTEITKIFWPAEDYKYTSWLLGKTRGMINVRDVAIKAEGAGWTQIGREKIAQLGGTITRELDVVPPQSVNVVKLSGMQKGKESWQFFAETRLGGQPSPSFLQLPPVKMEMIGTSATKIANVKGERYLLQAVKITKEPSLPVASGGGAPSSTSAIKDLGISFSSGASLATVHPFQSVGQYYFSLPVWTVSFGSSKTASPQLQKLTLSEKAIGAIVARQKIGFFTVSQVGYTAKTEVSPFIETIPTTITGTTQRAGLGLMQSSAVGLTLSQSPVARAAQAFAPPVPRIKLFAPVAPLFRGPDLSKFSLFGRVSRRKGERLGLRVWPHANILKLMGFGYSRRRKRRKRRK